MNNTKYQGKNIDLYREQAKLDLRSSFCNRLFTAVSVLLFFSAFYRQNALDPQNLFLMPLKRV